MAEYLDGYQAESSFNELLRCIRSGEEPHSNARVAMQGVEVLMGAYRSALAGGAVVELPLATETNPLVG